MNKFAAVATAALAASAAVAVPGTINQKRGDITWQRGSKTYALSYKQGNMTAQQEIPLNSVQSLDVDKPANYDKLVAMVDGGQGAGAIAGLTQIVQTYRMLVWDKPAARYLVEAYISANNYQKAYDAAQSIISEDKAAAFTGPLAPAYWKALLGLGKNVQLENCLNKAATSGDRASSAAALVMRGDLLLATKGDGQDICRKALIDSYLRVVLMYTDEPCRSVRSEAMIKAADCFHKLSMISREEKMRAQATPL
jgi:hypothetical protein